METLNITGEIQNLRKDRKAVQINNEWYNFFKGVSEEYKKGDYVTVNYSIKGTFKNASKISIVEKKEPIPQVIKYTHETQVNPKIQMSREALSKNLDSMPNQTQNTILMNVSNIICRSMEEGKAYTEEEMTKVIIKLTGDFKKAFELL